MQRRAALRISDSGIHTLLQSVQPMGESMNDSEILEIRKKMLQEEIDILIKLRKEYQESIANNTKWLELNTERLKSVESRLEIAEMNLTKLT